MCFKCLYRKPYDMFSRNLFWKIWAIFFPLFQFVGQLVYYMSMVFTICHRLLVFTFLSPLFYKVTKLGEMVAIREWKIFIDFSIDIGQREWKIFIDFSIDIGQRSRSNSLTWIFTLSMYQIHNSPCSCRTVALRKKFCWLTGELQCHP